jgi:hypothetical protein
MVMFLRICLAFLVALAVLAGISYFLPRDVSVARRIEVSAPADAVFQQINSMQAFAQWSPWSDYDPDIAQSFSGPAEGVGNRMEWSSLVVGSGSQEITESVANESVRTTLDFGDMGSGEAWFVLEPHGGETRVTWGLDADMGNSPAGRYMGLMMDRWVGADYQKGLQRLKARAEAQAAAD